MSLSIAIQMDPVETLQIAGDTTFALGLEAQSAAIAYGITQLTS